MCTVEVLPRENRLSSTAISQSAGFWVEIPSGSGETATENSVTRLSPKVTAWAGIIYLNPDPKRKNGARDRGDLAGMSLWIGANRDRSAMFCDVLDNRHPRARRDDAKKYTREYRE